MQKNTIKSKQPKNLFAYGAFALWIAFIFRHLIAHISTAFIDWGDTSFIAWQIFITRNKLLALDFAQLPHTNSHYPYLWSLFFTDTFLGQSIMAVPLFFIKNPVLLHNILLLLTVFLNYLAAYHLFHFLFKSRWAGFIGSMFLNNSVYFFDQIIHLQTISYWPLLYMILLLLKTLLSEKKSILHSLFAGLLLSVQFYMAVYLGIFGLVIFTMYAATLLLTLLTSNKSILKTARTWTLHMLYGAAGFVILSSPLVMGYMIFEKTYHKVRDINEILMNSTHITDFLFFLPGTLLSSLGVIKNFNSLNRHTAAEMIRFPGFALLIGSFIGFFIDKVKIKRKEAKIEINNTFTILDLFFVLLIVIGFIFALGPRLNGNGRYLEIPLPYLIFLNKLSFLHSIRLTHRWIILCIIGLTYFATKFYSRIQKKYAILILILLIIETVSISIPVIEKQYIDIGHRYLHEKKGKGALVEYPFMNMEKGMGPDYAATTVLATTHHSLPLVNGYTGLFIQDYGGMRLTFEKYFPDIYTDSLIRALGVRYIKINTKYIDATGLEKLKSFYSDSIVYKGDEHIIIKREPLLRQAKSPDIKVEFRSPRAADYGDGKFFLNLFYKNSSRNYFGNTAQEKIMLRMKFFNHNKLVYTKELYDLYPLTLAPLEKRPVVVDFYLDKTFNKVQVTALSPTNRQMASQSISFSYNEILNITVLIQTRNEETQIVEAINSAKLLTNDIVVTDMESVDATAYLANKNNAIVYRVPYSRYVEPAREFGISKCKGDWIFLLDADERITEALVTEIQKTISNTPHTYFKVPRKNIFANRRWLKHGGWWKDHQIRLIKNNAFTRWSSRIHSTPEIKGTCGYLSNPIEHHFHPNLENMVNKTAVYEAIEADLLYKADRAVHTKTFFRKYLGELHRRMIRNMGFLDGPYGVIEALYQAYSKTITWLFLYEKKHIS